MAATTIASFGIRFSVGEDEIEALEVRSHPAIMAARKAGLDYYWGNFDPPGECYYLFLGKVFGKIGLEDSRELNFTAVEFSQTAAVVSGQLSDAGFTQTPSFYLQFQPDM